MAEKIKGNTDGLKAALIREYEQYLECQCGPGEYVPAELTAAMARFTLETGREIAFVLDRRNYVREISVGDAVHVDAVTGESKTRGLSGTRLLHTHPNGTFTASEQDLETLKRGRLDSMTVIGVRAGNAAPDAGCITGVSVYAIDPESAEGALRFGPYSFERLSRFGEAADRVREIDAALRERDAQAELRAGGRERAVLAGAIPEKTSVIGGDAHALDELAELAETAGATAVDRVTQRRDRPDVKYYLGSGVVDRVKDSVRANRAELVIFDDELSPSQIRNLEDALNVRVIDRTALILDIFAARAQSAEGKLQVELAQQKYRLPRLTGKGIELSRLGGGIGTRGPGESKLETDRRHINRKIHILESKLKELSARREVLRKERRRNNLPVVAVVGYTNAGKSTLVNALCDADVFVKDELFATLDTSVRRLNYGGDRDLLLVDTVGFIRKLPHDLIESFKATLEETVYADLLLHVVDASAPDCDECIDAVENILDEIGAGGRPRYLVLNKCDRLGEADEVYISDRTRHTYGKIARVSALTGEGLCELAAMIERYFTGASKRFELLIPYAQGAVIAELRRAGNIEQEDYREDGIRFSGTIPAELLGRFKEYSV